MSDRGPRGASSLQTPHIKKRTTNTVNQNAVATMKPRHAPKRDSFILGIPSGKLAKHLTNRVVCGRRSNYLNLEMQALVGCIPASAGRVRARREARGVGYNQAQPYIITEALTAISRCW